MNVVPIKTWSVSEEEEDGMDREHPILWRRMIELMTEHDLSEKAVLDFGCNQGGFLRMLYNARPYRAALGVDIAEDSVAKAQARRGELPVEYRVTTDISDLRDHFDIAFSHEVIYLLPDLAAHARDMFNVLRPGGVYYATSGCHRENPRWQTWRPMIQEVSSIPVPDYSVNDYADAFREAGFTVTARPFRIEEFVPIDPADEYHPTVADKLDYYSRVKTLFRLVVPTR